jgi:hypothetical protein
LGSGMNLLAGGIALRTACPPLSSCSEKIRGGGILVRAVVPSAPRLPDWPDSDVSDCLELGGAGSESETARHSEAGSRAAMTAHARFRIQRRREALPFT